MTTLLMFDIDGTLVRTDHEDIFFKEAICEWLSIDSINTDWMSYSHVTDSYIAEKLFRENKKTTPAQSDIDCVRNIYTQKWKTSLKHNPLSCSAIDGIHTFWERLQKQTDIVLAIATGGWESTAYMKLDHVGILHTHIPFASSLDAYSREEIMKTAQIRAERLNGHKTFEKIIYIGDGIWDLKASGNLGYDFIGIDSSNRADHFKAEGANLIFPDYRTPDQILELIHSI